MAAIRCERCGEMYEPSQRKPQCPACSDCVELDPEESARLRAIAADKAKRSDGKP